MFPSQGFTEIVFCAVTSNEQVKVRGTQGVRRKAENMVLLTKAAEFGQACLSVPHPQKARSGVQDFLRRVLLLQMSVHVCEESECSTSQQVRFCQGFVGIGARYKDPTQPQVQLKYSV